MALHLFGDMTIREIHFLAALPRFSSLRVAALAHGISAVNATRLLKGIERKLNLHLVERSHTGIALTDKAQRLALAAGVAVKSLGGLNEALTHEQLKTYACGLTMGSRGFLNALLAPAVIAASADHTPPIGLKFLDLSPTETVEVAKAGFLDLVVSLEGGDYGRDWDSRRVGALTWGLFASRDHPLAAGATKQQLAAYRLTHYAHWNGKHLRSSEGESHDWLGLQQTGYGAQTSVVALAIAAATDQVVCVPRVVARDSVALGRVVEIAVADWHPLVTPVHLAVRSDRLSQRQHQALLKAMKSNLDGPDFIAAPVT